MTPSRRLRAALVAGGVLAIVASGVLLAGTNLKAWVDPDAGLTHDQAQAAHETVLNDFFARLPQWIEANRAKYPDPKVLVHSPMNISVVAPASGFDAAVDAADAIVDGKVSAVTYETNGTTVVRFDVGSVLRGKASTGAIDIVYAGGISPWPDWDHAILAYDESAPIPDLGTRLVLFLQTSLGDGTISVQHWTGQYTVDSAGIAHALEGNPWAASFDGRPVTEIVDALATVMSVP
jgi:hypothetical protein